MLYSVCMCMCVYALEATNHSMDSSPYPTIAHQKGHKSCLGSALKATLVKHGIIAARSGSLTRLRVSWWWQVQTDQLTRFSLPV